MCVCFVRVDRIFPASTIHPHFMYVSTHFLWVTYTHTHSHSDVIFFQLAETNGFLPPMAWQQRPHTHTHRAERALFGDELYHWQPRV